MFYWDIASNLSNREPVQTDWTWLSFNRDVWWQDSFFQFLKQVFQVLSKALKKSIITTPKTDNIKNVQNFTFYKFLHNVRKQS